MTLLVEIAVGSDDFILGRAFDIPAGVEVELERSISIDEPNVPCVWVHDHEEFKVETAFRPSPEMQEMRFQQSKEDSALYQIRWTRTGTDVLSLVQERDGVVLEAVGSSEEWRFTIRFETQDDLQRFYDACQRDGIGVNLVKLYQSYAPDDSSYGLTETQVETLITAQRQGYFEVPKEIHLEELAEQFGVSPQSVSERLQRGLNKLVEHTLVRSM